MSDSKPRARASRPTTSSPGRIIAHRGASKMAPENTLAAFRLAAKQGTRWLEFDVSLLGDETPVIHHDATLDRCTDRSGPLTRLTAAALASIDSGSWFSPRYAGEPVATLEQALDLIAELNLSANLEMKPHEAAAEPMARAVAGTLERRPWARTHILVSSYDLEALAALRRLMPAQPLAVLWDEPPADWPQQLEALRASSLHIWYEFLTPEILARAQAEQVQVRVFTIDDPTVMEPFRGAGLTGVITNHPPAYLADPEWAKWAARP